jgi:capsular polysaccharide biosynthesis protein
MLLVRGIFPIHKGHLYLRGSCHNAEKTFRKTFGTPNGVQLELQPNPQEISGNSFLLGSADNFWHFLMNHAARLYFLSEDKISTYQFLVDRSLNQKQHGILTKLGIATDQLVILDPAEDFLIEHLTVVPCPVVNIQGKLFGIGLATTFLRNRLLPNQPPSTKPNQRLFLYRKPTDRRRLLNQEEICQFLQSQYGFRIVDPADLSLTEEITLMQSAAIVIAAYGATLTSILFAPKDCTVLQLIFPEMSAEGYYYGISNTIGQSFSTVNGIAELQDRYVDIWDFAVPLATLAAALDPICRG